MCHWRAATAAARCGSGAHLCGRGGAGQLRERHLKLAAKASTRRRVKAVRQSDFGRMRIRYYSVNLLQLILLHM